MTVAQSIDNNDWKTYKGSTENTATTEVTTPDSNNTHQNTPLVIPNYSNATPGRVQNFQSTRIKLLSDKYSSVYDGKMNGYRIQIYSGSDRAAANGKRSDFLARFPDVRANLDWEQPNFKVRVGSYRTLLQAQKGLVEVKERYPNAYIVKDEIELPRLGTPNDGAQ